MLRFRTPVKSLICSCVRMKKYTILDLAPFCIDSYTTFRHCSEIVFLSALLIYIPALKNISSRSCRWSEITMSGNVRAIRNIIFCSKLTSVRFCQRIPVSVNVCAIHVVDGIQVARVIEIQMIYLFAYIRIILLRQTSISTLRFYIC